jgi:hypothetical protein
MRAYAVRLLRLRRIEFSVRTPKRTEAEHAKSVYEAGRSA